MADVTMAHPDYLAAREGRMNTIPDTPIRPRVVPALIRRELARLDQIEAATRDALVAYRAQLGRARAERGAAKIRILEGIVQDLEADLSEHIPAARAHLEALLAEIEGGDRP